MHHLLRATLCTPCQGARSCLTEPCRAGHARAPVSLYCMQTAPGYSPRDSLKRRSQPCSCNRQGCCQVRESVWRCAQPHRIGAKESCCPAPARVMTNGSIRSPAFFRARMRLTVRPVLNESALALSTVKASSCGGACAAASSSPFAVPGVSRCTFRSVRRLTKAVTAMSLLRAPRRAFLPASNQPCSRRCPSTVVQARAQVAQVYIDLSSLGLCLVKSRRLALPCCRC